MYEQAKSWFGNIELFLDLGADIEAIDYQDETPLFAASGSFKPKAGHTMITKGANINAENKMKQTPLAKALSWCRNADIVNMVAVAEILLNAGTTVTLEMEYFVKRISKDFEFHREGLNKEYLNQTEGALFRLYKLFDVAPIEKRKTHDGSSPITITIKGWQAQHNQLWDLLIPSSGHAKTVQGEVIRITGKVSHEILGNGGVNWDNQYRKTLNALMRYFSLGTPLDDTALQEAKTLVKDLNSGSDTDELERLRELAVYWVLSNPSPITLEQPGYKR